MFNKLYFNIELSIIENVIYEMKKNKINIILSLN